MSLFFYSQSQKHHQLVAAGTHALASNSPNKSSRDANVAVT